MGTKASKARHIANELCGRGCGRALVTKTMCRECCDKVKAIQTNYRANGLCVNGDGRPAVAKSLCSKCADRQNVYRVANMSSGLCSKGCGRALATKAYCRECADKCNAITHGYEYNQKQRDDLREFFKNCEICKNPFSGYAGSKTAQVIDHCHKTRVIRGVLCQRCNKALGGFSDDIAILRSAITYLEAHL